MRLSDARAVVSYWREHPPEHEMLALLARTFTTWDPSPPKSEAEQIAEHRRSLRRRWDAGAMNAKDLLAAQGGAISFVPKGDR